MSSDKLSQTQQNVNDVKIIMDKNIQTMIHNNIKTTEILADKSSNLNDSAKQFHKSSKRLHRYQLLKKWKMNIIIIFIFFIFLLIIFAPLF